MINKHNAYIRLLLCFMICNHVYADPWFTGPLLAQIGSNIPAGHSNFQMYNYFMNTNGAYNQFGRTSQLARFDTLNLNPIFSHGLSNQFDIQLNMPYFIHRNLDVQKQNIGDFSAMLGLQVLEQTDNQLQPNLRITFEETLPSGRYDRLSATKLNTDATGQGSYQSELGLSADYILQLQNHYLHPIIALSYSKASPVTIQGLNSYGGTNTTFGTVYLGDVYTIDLAFEFAITQNWVAVMEGYYTRQASTTFRGTISIDNDDISSSPIGSASANQYSLSPAIEYNFSQNIGLIAGVWYTIKGHNNPKFTASSLALNIYW